MKQYLIPLILKFLACVNSKEECNHFKILSNHLKIYIKDQQKKQQQHLII